MTQSPLEVLRSVPILSNVPESDLVALAQASRERSYPAGQVILRQDAPGDAMYVVIEGRVKVVLIGEDGREVSLSVLGPGAVFGEMAPKTAPGPSTLKITSRPSSPIRTTLTRPSMTTYIASPGASCRRMTWPAG